MIREPSFKLRKLYIEYSDSSLQQWEFFSFCLCFSFFFLSFSFCLFLFVRLGLNTVSMVLQRYVWCIVLIRVGLDGCEWVGINTMVLYICISGVWS